MWINIASKNMFLRQCITHGDCQLLQFRSEVERCMHAIRSWYCTQPLVGLHCAFSGLDLLGLEPTGRFHICITDSKPIWLNFRLLPTIDSVSLTPRVSTDAQRPARILISEEFLLFTIFIPSRRVWLETIGPTSDHTRRGERERPPFPGTLWCMKPSNKSRHTIGAWKGVGRKRRYKRSILCYPSDFSRHFGTLSWHMSTTK